MLVDQSGILTEGNGDWKPFVVLAIINCAMQYRYGGLSATVKAFGYGKC
jgi:hypothetical protein